MEPVFTWSGSGCIFQYYLDVYRLYHVFFEEPQEPQSLPYEVIVYDRSNKAIIDYGAVCEVKDGVLYLYDATELGRKDVSHLVE